MSVKKILVINGPNLNLLGYREPEIYGHITLADIEKKLTEKAAENQMEVICFQSNHEGEIIDTIHENRKEVQGILINAGAYTHTSIAIRDALTAVKLPIIEIHLSNIYQREEFRHHSMIADIALGQITGLGWKGYLLALDAMIWVLNPDSK